MESRAAGRGEANAAHRMEAKDEAAGSTAGLEDSLPDPDLKVILLGDSAVGKSKLIERYLMDEYNPRQLSTYALTLFRKEVKLEGGETSVVDFWDTAGQEAFNRMHPSYYYRAHCCILLFDVTRKVTYQHLADWYKELREYCENIPVVLVANKIDVDYNVSPHCSSHLMCFMPHLTRLSLQPPPPHSAGNAKRIQIRCQAQFAILFRISCRRDQRGQSV